VLEARRDQQGAAKALLDAQLRPRPRVREAAALVAAGVRCAMDLSDGLLGDAAHICERSGVGAEISVQAVPVHPALAAAFAGEALGLAIGGGEDYELLCAAPAEAITRAETALAAIDTPLTVVGRLVDPPEAGSPVRLVGADGREVQFDGASWDHFSG
jgi:thiamine-monophosphate kinase